MTVKIKSITMVGNECEIIESFIRYNIQIVDEMVIIFEQGSVDASMQIVKKIRDEGKNIRIYDEALVAYEQKAVENKYMRMLAAEPETGMIVPLDADEFICSDGNPKDIIRKLDAGYVYALQWRNYLLTAEDDAKEKFIPKRLTHYDKMAQTYEKVIVSSSIVNTYNTLLTTGHHNVDNCPEERIKRLDSVFIAHYPIISLEQQQSKAYCSSISFILWNNRADWEGNHINKMLSEIENGRKDSTYSNLYNSASSGNIINKSIDLSYFDNKELSIKYPELGKIDLFHNITSIGYVMAIRSYREEIEHMFLDKSACRVLIYGTGEMARTMLNGIQDDLINIYAYINSSDERRFTRFNGRLVVTPGYIRYFRYDKILISSRKYYEEMKKTLLDIGVDEKRIVGQEYITELLIKKLG